MADLRTRNRAWPTAAETALVFGIWTLIGILFASSSYLGAAVEGERISLMRAASIPIIDVYTWALVSLVALWAARRFPIERDRLGRSLLATAAVGLLAVVARAGAMHFLVQATGLFGHHSLTRAIVGLAPPNFVTFWMLVGVAHAVEYARRFRERALRSVQLEAQLANTQLQMLKVQLHPHFLFNTLHAISTLVHSDPDAAEQTIASLSELLRSTLAHEQAQEVTVEEEMTLLAPYLEIEKIRLGDRLTLRMEIDPATRGALVPHFLLQPLVENAIRHGISPRRRGGSIEIRTERVGSTLRVSVSDDGSGFDPSKAEEGGVGLGNTRARLSQLYHDRHRFALHSEPEAGTRVVIDLPFHFVPRTAGPPVPA